MLLAATVARAAAVGVLAPGAHTFTLDSTGLSVERASAYYRWRGVPRPGQAFDGGWAQVPARRRWAKLTCVADVETHLVVGLTVAWGPTQDAPQLLPVLAQTLAQLPPRHWCQTLLADAGFDSERNRAEARALGVAHPVIALNWGGQPTRLPTTPERRRAAQRFPRKCYRQRAHAESVFSALKRSLGATIRARRPDAQLAAAALRVITYNLALLLPHRLTLQQSLRL